MNFVFIIHSKVEKWSQRALVVMPKNILTCLVALMFFISYAIKPTSTSKICVDASDCEEGKLCCGDICLKRKSCDDLCMFDYDCDDNYGEVCVDQKCTCASSPCLDNKAKSRIKCHYNLQCLTNETCKNGECQPDERTVVRPLPTIILIVVTTVGLVVFAGAFYLCLTQQKSSRPSLAAKEAHHHALERGTTKSHALHIDPQVKTDLVTDEDRGTGKNRLLDPKHKKPPVSSPCSAIELSAIMEEDEVSESISK